LTNREDVYTGKTIPEVLSFTYEKIGTDTSAVGRSARYLMNNYIIEATKNSTLSPFVYKEVLRSIIVSFGNVHYVNGNNKLTRIMAHHSAPERAVAKKFQENNMVLPVITVHQTSAKNDEKKRRYDNVLIQSSVWNDDIQRAERTIGTADVPVSISYSVNLWAKYMEDLDQISQSIRLKFNPSLHLETSFTNSLKCFLADESNNNTINAGDREDRLLRKSFTVTTEFFIPSPKYKITSTGRVDSIVSELWVS